MIYCHIYNSDGVPRNHLRNKFVVKIYKTMPDRAPSGNWDLSDDLRKDHFAQTPYGGGTWWGIFGTCAVPPLQARTRILSFSWACRSVTHLKSQSLAEWMFLPGLYNASVFVLKESEYKLIDDIGKS